jgi:transcriptional regulator with XRE-family HTH domain
MAGTGELGATIREARLKKGMSLGQLASAVGRSSSSVRRWERGEVAPAATVLSKLQAILEIEPAVLNAPMPVSVESPDAGSEEVEVPDGRVSTVEQPILVSETPDATPSPSEVRRPKTSDGGLVADVWAALTSGDRSWIGWIRGLLTTAVLVLMVFVLLWAMSELFDALRAILDSFDVGSSGDQSP